MNNKYYNLQMSRIVIHFDGDIASEHKISMRNLQKSLSHLQSAIDRAYLDIEYGGAKKHARLLISDYQKTQFMTSASQEGGYILNFIADTTIGKRIVDRVSSALRPAIEKAMESGERQTTNFAEQIETQKSQIAQSILIPTDYKQLIDHPPEQVTRNYGDRAIVKEFDQIASIIRSSNTSENSIVEFEMNGERTDTFKFDKTISKNFHSVVSERIIGNPVIYKVKVTSLDHTNLKGKILNNISQKEANIHFASEADFFKIKDFLGSKEFIDIIGCPLIEYGSFDPTSGDIYFVNLL